MLQFCINTFHSFLLTISQHNSSEREYSSSSSIHCRNILLGLRILIGEIEISNVLVIRRVITIKKMTTNQDSFSLGFLGSSAGSVMESMSSCTESLGFESSDQLEEDVINQERLLSSLCSSSSSSSSSTTTTTGLARSRFRRRIMIENERRMIDKRSEQVKNKIFPPPLSSLNRNGHRKFYLKSERDNGRLEITLKKINRPEILRASRQDGRLTLHLMKPQVSVSEIESKEEAELKESEEELNVLDESEEELNELDESVVKEDKERAVSVNGRGGASDASWKFFLPSGGGGESFRRCYDLTHHHHHHHHGVPLWSNHYVMTG